MSKELSQCVDELIEATLDFHRFMSSDLENPMVHMQVINRMRKDMPNAFGALKRLLHSVEEVKQAERELRD